MGETFVFGPFRLDADSFQIERDGKALSVEPLVFDLIMEFARHPGRLLTRDDLIAKVWDGRFVSDSTVSTAVKSARKALGDTGSEQRYIKTVRGRGFQFTADVKAPDAAAPADAPRPFAVQPSLYVEVTSFDGSVEAPRLKSLSNRLRTTLRRVPVLRVSMPFGNVDATSDPTILYSQYGLTYLMMVSLWRLDENLHVDVTLVETRSGLQLWARDYKFVDQSGVMEDVLPKVLAQFEPAIMRIMIEALSNPGGTIDPRGKVLKAIATLAINGWNRDSFQTASELLDEAIEADASMAIAFAYSALIRALSHRVGINRDDGQVRDAIELADKALELERQDSFVVGLAGCALCDAGELERGMPILHRAAELDPSNGHALTALGAAHVLREEFEDAVQCLKAGVAISPADSRLAVWEALLAMSELVCGRTDRALAAAEAATSRDDKNYLSRLALVAVLVATQNRKRLLSSVAELLRVHPNLTSDEVLFFCGERLHAHIWPLVERVRARG